MRLKLALSSGIAIRPLALIGASALLIGCPAFAQTPQPGGRTGDQFERRELPTSQPIPSFRIERPQPGQVADAVRFDVRRIVVEGAASVDAEVIVALTRPLEGRNVTLADLAAVADRITALYAEAGFALSFAIVPEQTVDDGVVRIRVVEGTVDAVAVEFSGAIPPVGRNRLEAAIRRRLAGLIGAGPVRTAAFERAVLGLSDLAGFDVSVVVRPSASAEGAATLVVIVTGDPLEVQLGADNRLRSEFGREEFFSSVAVGSLAWTGDRLELATRRAFETDAFVYGAIGYESPIGQSLARFTARYSRARTVAQRGLLGLLDYRGQEDSFQLGLRYPLIRARAQSLYLSAELGGIDTRASLFGIRLVDENVRSLTLGLTYDWVDESGARALMSLNVVQGLDGFGASEAGNPLRSRALGRPNADYFIFRYYRDQPLPAGLRLRVDHELQFLLSDRALPATSECTFGGPAIGRAYDAGVLSGDECWRGSAELARPIATPLGPIEPYLFLDGGYARQQGPLELGEARSRGAYSYGAGIRLFSRFGLTADLQLAHRATRFFPGEDRSPRLFFTLSYQR